MSTHNRIVCLASRISITPTAPDNLNDNGNSNGSGGDSSPGPVGEGGGGGGGGQEGIGPQQAAKAAAYLQSLLDGDMGHAVRTDVAEVVQQHVEQLLRLEELNMHYHYKTRILY